MITKTLGNALTELTDQTPSPHPILQTLTDRGWSFSQTQQLNALITIHSALADDHDNVANSLESDLLNTNLRSIGGKSLPDPLSLRKLSHLQGPKVLQVVAVRDIAVSSVEGFDSGSSHRRVLRLVLTDGHVEVTAIEYSRIPAIDIDSVVPGTKVRLENHVPVHSRIVCLGPKTITVIGGVVESLYEEWKMNIKYAGMSRSSLRVSQEADGGGPPPFEKLQIGAPIRRSAQRATHSVSIERFVSYRERAAGVYSALPFAFAQVVNELPYVFAQTIIYCSIFYSMAAFERTWLKFLWCIFFMYFTMLYFTFYGMMTTAITPNHNVAAIIAAPFYMLWNLFSGFMIPHKRIPIWWRWYYWANPIAWTLFGLVTSQYGDDNKLMKLSDDRLLPVRQVLKGVLGYRHDFLGLSGVMVVGFCCFFLLSR